MCSYKDQHVTGAYQPSWLALPLTHQQHGSKPNKALHACTPALQSSDSCVLVHMHTALRHGRDAWQQLQLPGCCPRSRLHQEAWHLLQRHKAGLQQRHQLNSRPA
jgi:hypothetical protein